MIRFGPLSASSRAGTEYGLPNGGSSVTFEIQENARVERRASAALNSTEYCPVSWMKPIAPQMQAKSRSEQKHLQSHDMYCSTSFPLSCASASSSFGDQYRAYLRGQLTIHKNRLDVNRIWRRCSHLTSYAERLEVSTATGVTNGLQLPTV